MTFCDIIYTVFTMVIKPPKRSGSRHSDQDGGTKPAYQDSVLRVGPMGQIPSLLRTFGIDPEPVFDDSGFTLEQFKDPELKVSYLKASRLMSRCVAESGCKHFGLLLGQSASPSLLGVPGFLIQSAPNVAHALNDLLHNLDLHDNGGSLTLNTSNGVTLLGYTIHQPGVEAIEQIFDLSIAMSYNIMRSLCGIAWAPTEVMLSRKRPRNISAYKNFFKVPIRFDAEESAIAFPSHWLHRAVLSADEFLHDHFEKEARILHELQHQELIDRLPEVLHLGVLKRRFSAQEISAKFKINERTLHRRLKAADTSFRHELDEVRQTLGLQLLANTNLSIVEIADVLAYKGSSSFIRAFKRWNDVSPQNWRRSHSQQ